jgi:hypothetical protein
VGNQTPQLNGRLETEFLASILRQPDAIQHVAGKIHPFQLYQDHAKRLLAAMLEVHRGGAEPTIAIVADHLQKSGQLDLLFVNGRSGYDALNEVDAYGDRCGTPIGYFDALLSDFARRERRQVAIELIAEAERPTGSTQEFAELLEHWAKTLRQVDVDSPELAPMKAGEFVAKFPNMREPIIHGLLREGETANIIASPKVGKSWLIYWLALSVALGRQWLGFDCRQGDVLIIDNELHSETVASRLRRVAEAMEIDVAEYGNRLHVQTLRGNLKDLHGMAPFFNAIKPGQFALIVIDAWYRFLPANTKENDNADQALLYNAIDRHAGRIGCSFVNVHHATKGSQSEKRVTDVGAGAGSQARAADAHIVIREHESKDTFVLDAVVRSFPPVAPTCLRWEWPKWSVDTEADPARLAGARVKLTDEQRELKRIEAKTAKEQEKQQKQEHDCAAALDYLAKCGKATKRQIRDAIAASGDEINLIVAALLRRGQIKETKLKRGKRNEDGYTLRNCREKREKSK